MYFIHSKIRSLFILLISMILFLSCSNDDDEDLNNETCEICCTDTGIPDGQSIIRTIDFDHFVSASDNDLVNNFYFLEGAENATISQVNSGGITGGGLVPPNELNWRNEAIVHCLLYENRIGSMIETSISFKYDEELINPNQNERTVAIFLDNGVSNRDIGFYITKGDQITVSSYNYGQSTAISLETDHWYNFVTQYTSIGGNFNDEVLAKAEVFDLGTDGTESPSSIGTHTASIFDSELVASTTFQVDVTGTTWGGSELLDDFVFNGIKRSRD